MRAIASYVTGVAILASIMFVGGAWTPTQDPHLSRVDVHDSHATFGLSESFAELTSTTTTTIGDLPPGCEIPLAGASCAITAVAGGLDVSEEAPAQDEEVPAEIEEAPSRGAATASTKQQSASAAPEPRRVLVPRDVEAWRPLVSAYFGPGETERALRVIYCESSGDPGAKNPRSSASGLFQHLARFWPERSADAGWAGADIFDPEANVAVAAWLVYQGGGWSHWNPSRHCWG